MSTTEDALSELRKKIEANKALLAEQEHALKVLEAMMGYSSKPAATTSTPPSGVPAQTGMFSLEELTTRADSGKQTLRAQVIDVIKRLGDQEFSVAHIDEALKMLGVGIKGKYPRSRISTILSVLEDSGMLTKTFTGAGNVPHKYVVVPAAAKDLV